MTKAELLDFAARHGIDGVSSSMTKAEIIAVLEEATRPVISGLSDLTVEVNEEFDPLEGVSAKDWKGKSLPVSLEE